MVDGLICHGEEARAQLTRDFGIPLEKIWVIPHGPLFDEKPEASPHEARAELGLSVQEPLVLFVGVISKYKGISFLLDAWKRLIASGGRGRLLIAGTGDPRLLSEIRETVSAEGLESSVDFWFRFIPVEQLPLLYQAADILVYPYKAGTTSGALLTGMNFEKAIIATNLPFFRAYLSDGENALLVDYGDTNALASCLRTLLDRPEECSRIARGLRNQHSQGVSWREIANATRKCYESLLEARPAGDQKILSKRKCDPLIKPSERDHSVHSDANAVR